MTKNHPRTAIGLFVFSLIYFAATVIGQTTPRPELQFQPEHRVIAHGNEYNDLALSSDERRLFIGTERGEVIVWNISEQRIERKLNHGKPVHNVVALADPRFIVASGEQHLGENLRSTVRKWNVETAAFEDMPGLGDVPFVTELSVERSKGLVAAAGVSGRVVVWDTVSTKVIGTWDLKQVPFALCLAGGKAYVSTISALNKEGRDFPGESNVIELDIASPQKIPQDFIKSSGRFWSELKTSPNGKVIAAINTSSGREQLTLFNVPKSAEVATISANASAWISDKSILTFDGLDPDEIVQIATDGSVKTIQKFERSDWKLSGGREFDLSGQVVLKDHSRAWSIYRKGAGFYEWDLKAKRARTLFSEHGGAYTLSVLPQSGLVLTGGLDGFIRLWNLADLSPRREFQITAKDAFVSDAELLPGGKLAVVATMPQNWQKEWEKSSTDITVVNLETGEQKKLLTINQTPVNVELAASDMLYSSGDRIVLTSTETATKKREFVADGPILNFAISANKHWLLAVDNSHSLYIFEVATGRRVLVQRAEPARAGEIGSRPLAITNDGRYVFGIAEESTLTRWDATTKQTKTMELQKLRERHSRVDVLILAENDTLVVTPGNHGDVGVFDSQTGELVSYTQTPAAAFWVEKAWLSGNRMIFTTDTGVVYSGIFVK